MSNYTAPLADMRFALDTIADLPAIAALPGGAGASPDVVAAVLEEAATFAGEALAPLNPIGDRNPSRLEKGAVRTPPGFAQAYRAYVAAGWNGLALPTEEGGHGLPLALGTAILEMWTSANLAFALCPTLTISAAELIIKHGSPAQRRLYRDKLVSGEWTGTMNITEPQAGSDVGAIRTRAVKEGDHYRVTGQKIFITYGDHDLAPNIVHMVLARTPDAPPGVKGLSLFVVPKFLVNDDGSLGAANDVACVKLEDKLGIHASPTCTLAYGDKGGAIGTLIGEERRGIDYMFLMMNGARLNIGLQGVAIAERAYQQARDFARGRVQGRPATASAAHGGLPILHHPDVRRMLLAMRAKTEASRALLYYAASMIDRARHEPDAAERARCQSRADLLIPVAKAWSTESGFEIASTNVQIHGGMGYIEETGAAQHLRDARIALIYEGTNGIQANDLLTRKLVRDEGAAMRALVTEMSALDAALAAAGEVVPTIRLYLRSGLAALSTTSEALAAIHRADAARALAGAVPYLRLVGIVTGGWLMAKAALAAQRHLDQGQGDLAFYRAKLTTARFFAEHELATASSLLPAILGGGTVMEFDADSF
jgi:alkylation response protein AidB-like acyl-CoA dehydrogenase